ncbi:hypothetical protein [Sphingopyxis sp. SCN 67-31]|uniref:hypothetical protein n=1 Tax=Sphingopyxis sp. SCN 67-31 TaxID=1660142 RepID=UPI000869DFB5|nr:hypothetical protein [Sphingopyxis sp. SCN 67-31]ODU28207.1 MAG: hypothetical protein ABS88_13470 [Sphingopyxis sp. SCN 67-31]
MATLPRLDTILTDAVEKAVRDLVCLKSWGDAAFVNLPLIAPDGSSITVRVKRIDGGFQVDDAGFTYRDLLRAGSDRSFAKQASLYAHRKELEVEGRMILVRVDGDDLQRAICDVGSVSWQVLEKVYSRLDEQETQIEEGLRERLQSVFGEGHLDPRQDIVGLSTNEWKVSAIVHVDGKLAVFQAVGDHANSIYRVSAAFHDIAALPDPPTLISVVKNRKALGTRLSLLAQAGHVIEEGQADEVYRRAVA